MTAQPKLTPYWQKIVTVAEEILAERIDGILELTADPSACILPEDALDMAWRDDGVADLRERLETIRSGTRAGKLWALETVLAGRPCLLFK